ncbi:MAG: SMC family ATPase [Chloroflexales bacterium]|nr:SMC family ATPase [Chloroflexales bacterium]
MVPIYLTLHNFMCYRSNGEDQLTLDLDGLHIVCLSGENGAGKSTLLDAITWALWGKARMSDDELIAQGETEMQVDLGFLLNGQRYRVTRKRQRGRSGSRSSGKSWLDFQVQGDHGWRPLGVAKIIETEQQIEQLLRMRYDTFINASFLLQGRADEFTRKTAGERKQVLADILDLRDYAMLEERAKRRAKRLADEIKGLEGIIGHLQQEADKLDLYAQLVTEAGEHVATLSGQLEAAEAAQTEAVAQLQALEAKLPRRKELATRLTQLRAEQQQHDQESARLRLAIAEAEALCQRADTIRTGVEQLASAQAELQRLEALRPRHDELRERWHELQDALKDERRKLLSERDRLENQQQQLHARAERRQAIITDLESLEQRQAELAPLADESRQLREHQAALDERLRQVNALLIEQRDLQSAIEKRQDSLVAVREEQKRLCKRLDQQLADAPQWQTDLAAAREEQNRLAADEEQLAVSRQNEQAQVDNASVLRAECQRLKEQAEEIKKYQTLLAPGQANCPVCRSELGHDGVEQVRQHYEGELQAMRARYSECKQTADAEDAALKQIRKANSSLERQIDSRRQVVARIATLEAQLVQAAAWQTERKRVIAQLQEVEQQLNTKEFAQEERTHLHSVESRLNDLGGDPAALEQERKTLQQQSQTIDRRLKEEAQLLARRETNQKELAAIDAELAALPTIAERSAALHDILEQGGFAPEIRAAGRTVEAELAALGYSSELHNAASAEVQRLASWAEEERRLSAAQIRLEADRRLLQQAAELSERCGVEADQLTREDALLEQELRALPTAQRAAQERTQAADLYRRDLKVAERDLTEKQTLRDRAAEAAEQLAQRENERNSLAERQGVFQELVEAFGKKGVQAMLIETAIPEIEREANRLLGRMSDNQMHLTFEMQRDTKKGDTVETLEIKIADSLGTRVYDAFSGGEAMRVNFAIRVALSRLLAHRAGANLETLVIDEGFGALDALGRERFVEAITSVQHDFKRILVITHIEDLKERFPVQIEITKTAHGSRWEVR